MYGKGGSCVGRFVGPSDLIDAGCTISEYVVCEFVEGAVCCGDGGIFGCWAYFTVLCRLSREVFPLLDERLISGNIHKGKLSIDDSAHMGVTVDFSHVIHTNSKHKRTFTATNLGYGQT